ncbi:hypothetical protein B0G80_8585 [Paraburkholderia sp. BL6669N2]|uniref:hypothetical protein n=1 Tax=Paraburkholderia sp. BL6669N2 TaxID=1938807 RepID=UPI000E282652|nr:hypothetical protein [Paraburkholderia sp. BL6669N2]REG52070.1 hypothetical protein B0G80_8585 [Paraburkholderia sp. BL6669N2]
MTFPNDQDNDSGLILAAEECPPESFEKYHSFSSYDNVIIRKLTAHGPVLIRGGRGSGKSALLLEAYRRMRAGDSVFPIYVSLRYLPLLQSDGEEYIHHFCELLSEQIQKELSECGHALEFPIVSEQMRLQLGLTQLAQALSRRIVLLFDDAAHIGREKPLEVFFDLFRTLSSNLTSCKASIYPGVTKFGVRFDVFNDSTVVDISRSDVMAFPDFFPDVVQARYPRLAERSTFSDRLSPRQFANLLGRAVVGNLRGFILACNRFDDQDRIGIPEVNKCFLEMAQDYYWPLMDEVAPKLGVYEPLIEPARDLMEAIVEHSSKPVKIGARSIAQDRVLIHRQLVSQYIKIFEILEYLGFVARREASRAMKSGGRGPVFAINLCSLLDGTSTRLTSEMIDEWLASTQEAAEIHLLGQTFSDIKLPTLAEEHGLAILGREVDVLGKSPAYPYGLGPNVVERLRGAGIQTVGELVTKSDDELDNIDYIGDVRIQQIRDVLYQAIWM